MLLGPSQKRKRVSCFCFLSLFFPLMMFTELEVLLFSYHLGICKSSIPQGEKGSKVIIFKIFFLHLLTVLLCVDMVLEVLTDMPAWPGRHLLEGGEHRRYFALKTVFRGIVEFECKNQREYDIWTQGVSRLLTIAAERNNRNRS